jgi:hypothetical protein
VCGNPDLACRWSEQCMTFYAQRRRRSNQSNQVR